MQDAQGAQDAQNIETVNDESIKKEIISKQLMNIAKAFTRLSNSDKETGSARKMYVSLANLTWAMWESYNRHGDFRDIKHASDIDND